MRRGAERAQHRLDAAAIAFILEHGEAKALLTDTEFAPVIEAALAQTSRTLAAWSTSTMPWGRPMPSGIGSVEYEALLAEGDPDFEPLWPADEWQAIALNYTSGTTGNPKGVVYHHRGAHLNAVGNVLVWSMPQFPDLSLDPADVPLQRLVLSLEHRACRPARRSACAASRATRSSPLWRSTV